MPYPGERDIVGNVWRPAPFQIGPMTTGSFQGVWAGPDDEVDWSWVHTPEGSYVNGYSVRRKIPIVSEWFKEPKEDSP